MGAFPGMFWILAISLLLTPISVPGSAWAFDFASPNETGDSPVGVSRTSSERQTSDLESGGHGELTHANWRRHYYEALEGHSISTNAVSIRATGACFTENRGQVQGEILYYLTGQPSFALMAEGALVVLSNAGATHAILIRFLNANEVSPVAYGGVCHVTNYLVGDAGAWRSGVPAYHRMIYRNLYEGIDLVYRMEGGLKAEFVISPGADPSVIRVTYEGADSVVLDAGGNLVLGSPLGEVVDAAPYAYQESVEGREAVAVSYRLGEGEVGFRIGEYDTARHLVLDPLIYSTFLGSPSEDIIYGTAVDNAGHVFVVGTTESGNLPTTAGAHDASYNGRTDVFVAKLSPGGTNLLYATYLGGRGDELAGGIAIDTSGSVYIAGFTDSDNFPVTNGALDTRFSLAEAFVAKLSPDGRALLYSTFLGGRSFDFAFHIVVDPSGSAHIVGGTDSSDFPVTANGFDVTYGGGPFWGDTFVAKLNRDGTDLVYATYLGGTDDDIGQIIALDVSGNAYVTGATNSPDFPVTPGAFDSSYNGGDPFGDDAFVAVLNRNGTGLVYATYLGGTADDAGNYVVVDRSGNAYVAGATFSTDFPTTGGAFSRAYAGGETDVFVVKLNPGGTGLRYATYLGGTGGDRAEALAVSEGGEAYVVGATDSADFPVTEGAFSPILRGGTDAFVAGLDFTGSALVYATYLGGDGVDEALAIHLDSLPSTYVVGLTRSADFPVTPGVYDAAYSGFGDAFIARLSPTGAPQAQDLMVNFHRPGTSGILHVVGKNPTYAWEYVDPEGRAMAGYQVRVGTAPGLTDIWEPGPVAGVALEVTHGGSALAAGTDYYLAVRVHDGIGWSSWNETRFHTNAPPPTLALSGGGLEAFLVSMESHVALSWGAAEDADGDSVTYFWYVSTQSDFSTLTLDGSTTATSLTIPVDPSTRYYVRVQGWDAWEFGANSTVLSFDTAPAFLTLLPFPWWGTVLFYLGVIVFGLSASVVALRRRRKRRARIEEPPSPLPEPSAEGPPEMPLAGAREESPLEGIVAPRETRPTVDDRMIALQRQIRDVERAIQEQQDFLFRLDQALAEGRVETATYQEIRQPRLDRITEMRESLRDLRGQLQEGAPEGSS